ncbi:MAG TPA: hypothetical protein VFU43_13830 [Streptosporangiaceae bacterium]|nr:hypothetical protein [Streptosporangiaceae bacterium]
MIVAIALAGLAVVVAVVMLASGMGGELADTHPDHPPLPLPTNRPIAGTDAALLRLPLGLWGYHTRVTDEALRRLSYALTERDTRIAILEQQAAELRHKLDSLESGGATTTRAVSGAWHPPDERDASWTSPSAESLELESRARRAPERATGADAGAGSDAAAGDESRATADGRD